MIDLLSALSKNYHPTYLVRRIYHRRAMAMVGAAATVSLGSADPVASPPSLRCPEGMGWPIQAAASSGNQRVRDPACGRHKYPHEEN
ncbi:hypothetical protein DAI22_04g060332 [Oryza sativa Japonica Group]|uniref:Uncharacterized protein n=1 Tax=Oryza rufipogon TaxID=4529 RepID=A0A0E0PJT5_ORYRU|nr:hypothetical protein DAI22_04g060332 [Oryza sativa Japonica Group]